MAPHDEKTGELTALLEQIVARHRQLLELLKAEQKAIIAGPPEALQTVAEQKAMVVQTLREMECRRIMQMGPVASILGRSGQELSLKQLAASVDAATGQQLLTIRRQLRGLICDIQRENRINKNLLGDSLRFVRSAMQTLSDLISPHASYGQNGQVRGRNAGGKVIQGQI